MRVIAGKAKGHRLKSPRSSRIRPTSDLVRGAIFSMLESATCDWSRVLDLYAGTGALGIEALSRGAQWADFVEQDSRCCALIKENLQHTGLASQARVYCLSVRKALSLFRDEYGLILLDPPYSDPYIAATLDQLTHSRLVGVQSTIVVEHSRRRSLEAVYGGFHRIKNVRHGDTCISVYQSIDRRTGP